MAAYTGMTVAPATATLTDDDYVQLTATAHYDDGSSQPVPWYQLAFASSNITIASPSSNDALTGRVYGVNPGTATITATITGQPPDDPLYHAAAVLTVTAAPVTPAPPGQRFSLAFGADTHAPHPTWTPLDEHPNLVTSYSIDRGRSAELDDNDAGHATVTIKDPDGILDPTNPTGPYYGQIRPLLPALICRRNPVTNTWENRFRGFIEDYSYDLDPSQRVNELSITLVDLFDVAGAAEMQPGQFGLPVNGQVRYLSGQTSSQRIIQILGDVGLPSAMWVVLPGAVTLQQSTYSAGETALSAMQEAADGEFPHVANVFCDRHGRVTFLGRKFRFDPAGVATGRWDYHDWHAGDGTAVTATPSTTAQVRALSFERTLGRIINTAVALEAGAPDGVETGRRVTDTGSVNTYGIRSWSATNLLTLHGDLDRPYPTSAATETKRFAQFYTDNYAHPQDRISSITFRSLHPDDPRAAANWDLLSRIDIGHTIEITITGAGGGGFTAASYFVEGIHEDVKPLTPGYDDVTVTLDLSPRAHYASNAWAAPLPAADPAAAPAAHAPKRTPPGKAPATHGPDHRYDGPDPLPIDYENVGDPIPPDDGGGSDVNLDGYLHYGVNPNGEVTPSGSAYIEGTVEVAGLLNVNTHFGGASQLVVDESNVLANELGVAGAEFAANVTGRIGLAAGNLITINGPTLLQRTDTVAIYATSISIIGLGTIPGDPGSGFLYIGAGGVLKIS